MWAFKEQVSFKQVGREFQKLNEQCPTEGMHSDQHEQAKQTEKQSEEPGIRQWAVETETNAINHPSSFSTLIAITQGTFIFIYLFCIY